MADKEMTIDSVRVSLMNYHRTLILKEEKADRYLPMWIGPNEADAIAMELQGIQSPRPLTHDLICDLLYALGASLKCVVIDRFADDLFYAKIIIITRDGEKELDCRPSDAVALAVRLEAPILADEGILDKAGVVL